MIKSQIKRAYQPVDQFLEDNRVLVVYGPRRVGKTTLINQFLSSTKLNYKLDSGDDIKVQGIVSSSNIAWIKEYCKGYDLIVLDEAQNIPEVGKGLKIMVDHIPGIKVIATGSSSFDLSSKIGEPLVGRQRILKLFPVATMELLNHFNRVEVKNHLEELLIFGSYPEVLIMEGHNSKARYLVDLVNAYLLKDILALERVRSPKVLLGLLRLLAYQIGSEASMNELANNLRMDVKTIGRYLDLLEKSFIIFSLGGFNRSLRNEVTSKRKYYFYDTGIRNAIINAFNPMDMRNDKGALWENWIMMERLKKKVYQSIFSNDFFWRTYARHEIDLIEEREGKLYAYEFKWKDKAHKTPKEWTSNYPGVPVEFITSENFFPFIV
ncbi:MAG: ATP-binding protein [Cyclobacteriaceae bacterium]|nr:ATP-binding protein [Cyclobacteriaceae bacterium]MCB0499550.1 ATP-binding protein [Cyclobacteriaceae bacterium]MCB9238130.1 ATP-binding protein [Flammeovirgaceae bacterium]MCW5901546.1 ATP-binding protein [Cyclobacteriaceae bacterium]HPI79252.1 ATP-binding protein [Cyclobacteriaceae bacterium]